MKRKKGMRKVVKKAHISNTKLLFLSVILLFIVFEALYLLKSQHQSYQASRIEQSVAGASVNK